MKKLIVSLLPLLAIFGCSKEVEPLKLEVVSFNIRYDNPDDSLNVWSNRKEAAANTLLFLSPDVIGTQEVLSNQLSDMKSLMPEYESVGVGREDGKTKGEYSAILYKKDRFNLISSGTFWLSENPEAVGKKGWDAACERVVTWAKFQDKKTNKSFVAFNTHFDHRGKIARKESVALLLNRMDSIANGEAAFVTGDFNSDPNSSVIKSITSSENPISLRDSRSIASVVAGPAWTFHDFGELPMQYRELIDFVFVNKKINVDDYAVINGQIDSLFISDHNPVAVKLSFN
ncbi:MAG: endonuclease/exonuclease/phosphatase family protein [Bacteroidales bacterium]|nr:endonuclease/exonuclease/phosphatase family protein [Bacteroidales bacterium]